MRFKNTSGEITPDMGLGDVIATLGNSFVGVINSDKEGNAAFSNGVSQAWCADFVTSIVKQHTNQPEKLFQAVLAHLLFQTL